MVELGDKVKDKITGYTGIVVGITSWQNGCRTVGIKSLKLKDGIPQDSHWLDENQLEVVQQKARVIKPISYKVEDQKIMKTGGPHEIPGRMLKGY